MGDNWVVGYVFGSAVDTLMRAWQLSSQYSSEELYNKLCRLEDGEPLPYIRDNEIPYSNLSTLQKKYRQYLNRFKRDGKRPHPAELLALLVLQDIDKYRPKNGEYSSSEFDTDPDFDNKIEQVIRDFQFSESELYYTYDKSLNLMNETYGDEKGKLTNPKLKDRIFCCVRSTLFSVLINYPDSKPEEIYNELYFLVHGRLVPIEQQKESLPKYKPKCRQRKPIHSIPTTGFNF